MFCQKCGRPTDQPDQLLCPECAAAQNQQSAEPQQPTEQQIIEQQPTEQQPIEQQPAEQQSSANVWDMQPNFSVTTEITEPPKDKKKLLMKILIPIIAVLAVGGILCGVFWDSVSSFFNRTFQKPEDYISTVEEKALKNQHSVAGTASGIYGRFLEALSNPSAASESDIRLTLSDELVTMLQAYTPGMKLDWLENLTIEVDTNSDSEHFAYNIGIGINDTRLLTAQCIMDMADMQMYLTIPELNSTALRFDLAQLYAESGIDASVLSIIRDTFPMLQSMGEELADELPSESEVEAMISKYILLVFSSFEDVEKDTETIEVGDISQKMTVLEASVDQKDLIDMAINVLKEAEDDKTLKKFVSAFAKAIEKVYQNMDGVGIAINPDQLFDNGIPSLIEQAKQLKNEIEDPEELFTITTYVDMKDQIVGRAISIEEMEGEIFYLTAQKGDKFAFEFNVLDKVILTGKGTKKGNIQSATYELEINGVHGLTIELENFDLYALQGTLRLLPGADLQKQLSSSTVGAAINLASPAIELKLGKDSLTLSILTGGKALLSLDMNSKSVKASPIQPPTDSVEASTHDTSAIENWARNIDPSTLIQKLQEAGIPMDLLGGLTGSLPI